MGFLRNRLSKANDSYLTHCAVGVMVPKSTSGRILRWCSSMSRAAGIRITSFVRTARDPILPLVILGVAGVALFASFILKVSDDIVFGIVCIGGLTAFLEIKMRNDNRE